MCQTWKVLSRTQGSVVKVLTRSRYATCCELLEGEDVFAGCDIFFPCLHLGLSCGWQGLHYSIDKGLNLSTKSHWQSHNGLADIFIRTFGWEIVSGISEPRCASHSQHLTMVACSNLSSSRSSTIASFVIFKGGSSLSALKLTSFKNIQTVMKN